MGKKSGEEKGKPKLLSRFDPVESNLIISNPPHSDSVVALRVISGAVLVPTINWSDTGELESNAKLDC